MIPILSLVTSIKDYLEVVHKLIEYDSLNINPTELGSIITFIILSLKNFVIDFFNFTWLKNIWSLPIIVPDINTAMISEISVFDGFLHNALNFLEQPIPYGDKNIYYISIEKFTIGLLNSLFLCLPTSIVGIITLRFFIMQGLEAGFLSGIGAIAGNLLWIASVILGWRFFVIPWLSMDLLRYLLGFIILVKYMWESYNERKQIKNLSQIKKLKIFLLSFLLSLTEQTSIYPFISNLTISSEVSIFESSSIVNLTTNTISQFLFIHFAYLLGLLIGSISLLYFTCWFLENPAFKFYMWLITNQKNKISTNLYYKILNFIFLYLTMFSALTSIPYYGLDYTITQPIGYVNDDRFIQDKTILETSFLGSKASDRNTRRNRGRHGRRERWKRRIRKYRTFDATLYDQGIYDLFTIEDLNYGFDRFWLRRKLRNHRVRFRFFPGPWMRTFKKQLAKPRLESYTGPRIEFFRILFEQVYHPTFHAYQKQDMNKTIKNNIFTENLLKNYYLPRELLKFKNVKTNVIYTENKQKVDKGVFGKNFNNNAQSPTTFLENETSAYPYNINTHLMNLRYENSTLRKFVRKFDKRLKTAEMLYKYNKISQEPHASFLKRVKNINPQETSIIYLKKQLNTATASLKGLNDNYSNEWLSKKSKITGIQNLNEKYVSMLKNKDNNKSLIAQKVLLTKYTKIKNKKALTYKIAKKDYNILRYKSLIINTDKNLTGINNKTQKYTNIALLQPLKFYLQKQKAFEKKLHYYTPNVYRQFTIENNAPYFRVMMRRYFYNYKPTNRWERTMKIASLRKARRKTTRIPKRLVLIANSVESNTLPKGLFYDQQKIDQNMKNGEGINHAKNKLLIKRGVKPQNYTVVNKRASRYRYQIYKDVLQHWYYSPFNRILMKWDVDSFIKRQPNAHFLTSKEENLLHLRRFLLSEHYNTLRWYTNMEHYRTMKTKINGIKSFSSNAYNQQFVGTFKKIRHLFAITPSQNNTVLKFDQALYNEYKTIQSKKDAKDTIVLEKDIKQNLFIHEELLNNSIENKIEYKDMLSQSQTIVQNSLIQTRPIREDYIKELLKQKNYIKLTQFLFKGQKMRGTEPITNQRLLNKQENEILLTKNEKVQIYKSLWPSLNKSIIEDLYLTYLKKWKHHVNDQESLKNYLASRIEKREKRKQRKEKHLLEKIQLITQNERILGTNISNVNQKNKMTKFLLKQEVLTTGLQKSIFEGLLNTRYSYAIPNGYRENTNNIQKDINKKNTTTLSRRIESKKITPFYYYLREKFMWKYLLLNNTTRTTLMDPADKNTFGAMIESKKFSIAPTGVVSYYENINNAQKIQISKKIKTATTEYKNIIANLKNKSNISSYNLITKGAWFKPQAFQNKIYRAKNLIRVQNALIKVKNFLMHYSIKQNLYYLNNVKNLLKPMKRKNLKNWRKKERAIEKQKRLRKDFKLLTTKKLIRKASIIDQIQVNNLPYYLENNKKEIINANTVNVTSRKKLNKDQMSKNEGLSMITSLTHPYEVKTNFDYLGKEGTFGENAKQTIWENLFDFKRKRTPQRRSRTRRNRGVFKKRTLNDQKNALKSFYVERSFGVTQSQTSLGEKTALENETFNNNLSIFEKNQLKQRKSKQRKQRFWKQKRSKYSQKRRKYRKRRRYAIGKIRVLSKQLKRVKNKLEINNMWWKNFIPSIETSTDVLWQMEKDQLIQQKLSELTPLEILHKNKIYNETFTLNEKVSSKFLQIGKKDFKPLALPESLKQILTLIKDDNLSTKNYITKESILDNNKITSFGQNLPNTQLEVPLAERVVKIDKFYEKILNNNNFNSFSNIDKNFLTPSTTIPFYAGWDESLRKFIVTNRLLSRIEAGSEFKQTTTGILNPTGQQTYVEQNIIDTENNKVDISLTTSKVLNTDSLTTQRKVQGVNNIFYTQAPLQGMNAATTLYWQIPFTTYDPDQFFALGMDGFSPIGWRKFVFRHSILKSWLNNVIYTTRTVLEDPASKGTFSSTGVKTNLEKLAPTGKGDNKFLLSTIKDLPQSTGLLAMQIQYLPKLTMFTNLNTPNTLFNSKNIHNTSKIFNARNFTRRLKKRYRRVKKHPRTPVWFPSGTLLNQVLPVHYIYVFYKRARLPRDRYLKRRLLNKQKISTLSNLDNLFYMPGERSHKYLGFDFTLRKRLKPKRKYHLKRDYYTTNIVIPQRFKFINQEMAQKSILSTSISSDKGSKSNKISTTRAVLADPVDNNTFGTNPIRIRPLSTNFVKKLKKPIADIVKEQKYIRLKQSYASKKTPMLRVKQLRRRVQRQILRSVWRYRPRAGGFVWPGDYLKFELIKAPKLVTNTSQSILDNSIIFDSSNQTKDEINIVSDIKRKTKRKKKRSLVEWQIQPKKYLYEKHNINVLKKKLKKAQSIETLHKI